jgi:hypothetical protein
MRQRGTAEGGRRGAQWGKAGIWGNMTPSMTSAFGGVDNVTGGDFLNRWRQQFDREQNQPFRLSNNATQSSPSSQWQSSSDGTTSMPIRGEGIR